MMTRLRKSTGTAVVDTAAGYVIDGVEMPLRPNLGLYTQPISFIGLPVVSNIPMPHLPMQAVA